MLVSLILRNSKLYGCRGMEVPDGQTTIYKICQIL